jgi:hypothetical protein
VRYGEAGIVKLEIACDEDVEVDFTRAPTCARFATKLAFYGLEGVKQIDGTQSCADGCDNVKEWGLVEYAPGRGFVER